MTTAENGAAVSFPAIAFDSRSPSGLSCRVALGPDGIEASGEAGGTVAISYMEMRLSFVGENDKYLCIASESPGVRVLVSDRGILPALEAMGLPRGALQSLRLAVAARGKRRTRRLASLAAEGVALVALALALFGLARWAVANAVATVPPEWELEIGRAAAEGVLADTSVCTDPAMNAAVEEIGRRLVAALGATPYKWKVRVLDAAEVNAFALPGGYIFVNRGLIERADDGAEVAGVLAHEMEHVQNRHGIENIARQLGMIIAVRVLLGDVGALEQAVAGDAAQLASMSFNRDQERDADRLGLDLVHRARLDPTGLERFMAKLAAEEGTLGSALSFLSTHPASADRAEDLEAQRRAWKPEPLKPLTVDWSAAKAKCAPISVADPDAP